MLSTVKLAMMIMTSAYDAELTSLIEAALADLGIAGIQNADTVTRASDYPLIKRAVVTYCRLNFGSPEDYDRLKRAYDEQKAQLQMATGYTDWGEADA